MNAVRPYLHLWRPLASLLLFIAGAVTILTHDYHASAVCFMWGWLLDDTGKRTPQLRKNQAIVTAPVEPSSDIRQAARAMTEIRAALIEAGYTSEQAAEQIAAMIANNNGGAR